MASFLPVFFTNVLYAFLFSLNRATCPVDLIFHDLNSLVISSEVYKL
jgi:hypothetical protein